MDKDALYLEVDEDITSAIDKLKRAPGRSVSIVVPKRSTLLQSVINLKLMQKAAKSAGKELVLVTNDKTATALAARVGLSVAASLGGKAAKAMAPEPLAVASEEVIDESTDFGDEAELAEAVAPVVAAKPTSAAPIIARRDLSDDQPGNDGSNDRATAAAGVVGGAAEADSSAKADKLSGLPKPKVPDFTKLQRRLMWVGGAVAIVVAYLGLMYYFSSAKVTLYAAGTKADVTAHLSADPSLTKSDIENGALAAQQIKLDKDLTSSFTPTGSKDVGTKASGTVTLQNCEDSSVYPLSQGFILTSQGLNYATDAAVEIPPGTFSNGGKTCTAPKVSVHVTATQSGDKYNLTNASFTSGKLTTNFIITGSMSGGTTKTVKVVTQADVDKAKAALLESDKASQKELDGKVPSGYQVMTGSFAQVPAAATVSPAVGEVADQASISFHVVDTELAVSKSDYHDAVRAQEVKAIGRDNQLYDDGLAAATITASAPDVAGRQNFQVSATASGGPKLDTAILAKSISGKKYGEATDYLSKQPGVSRTDLSLWPSWQTSLPHRASNIKITISVVTAGG